MRWNKTAKITGPLTFPLSLSPNWLLIVFNSPFFLLSFFLFYLVTSDLLYTEERTAQLEPVELFHTICTWFLLN